MKILKTVLVVVGLFVGGLIIYGMMNTPFTVETRVEIDRPVEQAWTVFDDENLVTQWISGLQKIEITSGKKGEVGSTYRLTFLESGEEIVINELITAYEPNKRIAFDIDHEIMFGNTDIRLESRGENKCELISVSEMGGKGIFMKGLMAMGKSSVEARQQKDYNQLKTLIEAQPLLKKQPDMPADSSMIEG